jgi:hypothetical protein
MLSRNLHLLWYGLVVALSFGCKKESDEVPVSAASAPPNERALDPDIAQAVAAASARTAPGAAGSKEGGPPPNGIFSPAAAEKEAPKGSPPKITLGSEGSDPKVALGPAQPKPGSKVSGKIRVEVQADPRQGGLPIEFGVTLEAQKPGDAAAAPGPVTVIAKVTSANIGMPGAPPDLVRDIGKLRGSKVEYQVLPDGGATGFRYEAAKGVAAEFEESLRALSDTLAVITLPYPDKPVGVGAYWMATSRDGVFGLDLVSYRLVKVENIAGGRATLSVNTKRYSASPTLDLSGLPPGTPNQMTEFQALAEGNLDVVPGRGFPSAGEQTSVLGAAVGAGNGKQPAGTLQLRTRAKIDLSQ